jgi:hypothetical protein
MKLHVTLLFFITAITSNGQDYKPIFLGKDGLSYKGTYLKYKEGMIGGTNNNFYSEMPTKNFQSPVYRRSEKYDFVTDTNSIKNREFLVVDVKACTFCYDNTLTTEDYIFELNDGKETIYFIYDGKYQFNFPFLVKGFSYSKEYLSRFIEKSIDEIEGDTTYRTPLLNDMALIRVSKNGKKTYYLSLETRGSTLNTGGTGVTVLFQDGTKWSKPSEKIDVKVVKGTGWGYRAFITLNQSDLVQFSKKVVKKFRLYIYDNEEPDEVEKFPFYVQSIMESK